MAQLNEVLGVVQPCPLWTGMDYYQGAVLQVALDLVLVLALQRLPSG